MRRLLSVLAGMLLALLVAAPALAARPTIISFAGDDALDSALFTRVCGFAVSAESSGHVVLHNEKRGSANFIANWNINTWLTSEWGTYHLVDAGPDMQLTRAGTTYFTVTGRSLTLSGVIGRVEVDMLNGEVTYHGKLGTAAPMHPAWYAPICDALDGPG